MPNVAEILKDLDKKIADLQATRDSLASTYGEGKSKRVWSKEARANLSANKKQYWDDVRSGKIIPQKKKVAAKKASAKKVADKPHA